MPEGFLTMRHFVPTRLTFVICQDTDKLLKVT